MNPEKVWRKLQAGHFANIAFGDLVALLRELGFELDHISAATIFSGMPRWLFVSIYSRIKTVTPRPIRRGKC